MSRPVICVLASADDPPPDLDRLAGRAQIRLTDAAGLPQALAGAQVLLLWDFFSEAVRDAWPAADRLQWLHVCAAGVNTVLFPELVASEVVVTNARGIFDRPIAEYVLGAVLAHAKQSRLSYRLQTQQRWHHRETTSVLGQRALVVGTGPIGRATARLLRAVGLEVRGAGRRSVEGDPDFGTVVTSADLARHVGDVDHLVMVAPLTEQTRNLIDADVLAAMKPSAHLINVGRGACVEEGALVSALETGRLAGATLDVVAEEPLRTGHPLWSAPGVTITAHLSGDTVGWRDRLAAQFEANAELWLAGRPLPHVVDKTLGYPRH